MKVELLEKLVCPKCFHELKPDQNTALIDNIIIDGSLICENCLASFHVRDGVPIFSPTTSFEPVKNSFDAQWKLKLKGAFESDNQAYLQNSDTFINRLEDDITQLKSDVQFFIDVGCGSCTAIHALAQANPDIQFIAVDFAANSLREISKKSTLNNVHYISADLSELPFTDRSFEVVWSIGVLHHTPSTSNSFKSVSRLTKPGGVFRTFIYIEDNSSVWYLIRDVLFLGVGHKLPSPLLYWLCRILAVVMFFWPNAPGLDTLACTKKEYYKGLVFFLYDTITPEIQNRHNQCEVHLWYKSSGYSIINTNPAGHYRGVRKPV